MSTIFLCRYRAVLLGLTIVLACGPALAAAGLQFSRSGDDLTITAADPQSGESYWRLVLDESRGVITSFCDLTSAAGESWNFVSRYGYGSGLFAPFGNGIRNGGWDYAPGETVDGQDTFTYTLEYHFGDDGVNSYLTTVTLAAPTAGGTVISARTECVYEQYINTSQKTAALMQLYATDAEQMAAIYTGSMQGELDIDGTLWSEIAVQDSPEALALGLTPGRSFRVTALNFSDGTIDLEGAYVLSWHDSFGVQGGVSGGIYDGWASKPPAGSLFSVYTRMDINIVGDAVVTNLPPVAAAGDDQELMDLDNDGLAPVRLDASASYDNDGAIMAYGWTLDGAPLATGAVVDVDLPVGENHVTLTVTDDRNASATDEVVVTVTPRAPRSFHVACNHPQASDANSGLDPDAPLMTINAATGQALSGDTVIVHEGIYRQRVGFASDGLPEAPITLRAAAGERAVVSGSDELSGWTPLTADLARGNTNLANIYYVDIDWEPARLYEDEQRMTLARTPNLGWWVLGEGTAGATLVDAANLPTLGFDPTGATVFYRDLQPVNNGTREVVGYDGSSSLTLGSSLGDTATPGVDLYYLFNRLEMLDAPGEVAVEPLAEGLWRVFLWPSDSGDPAGHLYEATRRNNYLLSWGSHSHIVIDGMEVRGGQLVGINDSYAMGSSSGGDHVEIRNCIVHDNEYMGVHVRSCSDIAVRNCLIFRNGYGVAAGYSSDILIKHNEVYDNTVDGVLVTWGTARATVEGNYVHDHVLWGHPDNCQLYEGPSDVWFIDNVMINAGQGIMMEQVDGVHFVNNIILGTHAYMLIIGHSNCDDVVLDGNTMAFSGYGLINNTSGLGRTLAGNIFYQGHSNAMFGAADTMDYSSDYNVFYLGDGLDGGRVVAWNGAWLGWESYLSASGQDSHSAYGDPLFANAPKLFDAMDANDLPYYLANRVYLRSGVGGYAVGDHIEFDFDGVVRTVSASGSDDRGGWIEFTPAYDAPREIAGVVCNWKDNDDYALDLTLQATSPAIARRPDGSDCGSTLSLPAYLARDFDGDGLRDVPVWPVASDPQPVPGDADGDGHVNVSDFIILKQNYNTASGATLADGDFNGDGAVDVNDFIILKRNYNR